MYKVKSLEIIFRYGDTDFELRATAKETGALIRLNPVKVHKHLTDISWHMARELALHVHQPEGNRRIIDLGELVDDCGPRELR